MNRKAAILAALGTVAFGLRALYFRQIAHAPFFDLRIGDAAAYHAWAEAIAAGDWMGRDVFYQAPLYPYVLALIYRVFGEGIATLRLLQAAMGAGSCVLLAAAGMRLFGQRGAIAGLLLAIYPTAIFLDGLLEKSVLVTFLTAALLYLLAGPRRRAGAFAAGVVLGLLALVRENALLLIAPVLLWIAASQQAPDANTSDVKVRPSGRRPAGGWKLIAAGWVVAGCAVVLVPVGLRNYAVGGGFQLTTAQFGPNFYIGNHAGANGAYQALVRGHGSAADERNDATALAERATGRTLTSGEVSKFWTAQALAFIRAQPGAWLRQVARKIALTFNTEELADTESQELYAEWSPILRLLQPFNFGVLLGLAVFGMVLTARDWQRLWVLYALGVTYVFSMALFYVFSRYRFPLVPILMLFAAGGVVEIGLKRRPSLIPAIVAAAAAVAVAHLPLGNPGEARVTHELDIANALSKDPARLDIAMEFYQRALRGGPELPPVQSSFAMFLAQTGHPQEAIAHYRKALEVWPDDSETRFNLGLSLAASGQKDEALRELDEALRAHPDNVEMQLALAQVLVANGRADVALQHYERALAIQPRNPAILVGWGNALTQLGRSGDALEKYRLALALDPQSSTANNNLGWTLASQGHIAEAIPYFERALALNPGDEDAKRNLERARQLR